MRTHLSKRDIEQLLDSYDADPVGALTAALQSLAGATDQAWDSLATMVPESVALHQRLQNHDIDALDAVVKHLVENRCLQQ